MPEWLPLRSSSQAWVWASKLVRHSPRDPPCYAANYYSSGDVSNNDTLPHSCTYCQRLPIDPTGFSVIREDFSCAEYVARFDLTVAGALQAASDGCLLAKLLVTPFEDGKDFKIPLTESTLSRRLFISLDSSRNGWSRTSRVRLCWGRIQVENNLGEIEFRNIAFCFICFVQAGISPIPLYRDRRFLK
jgi:hypothetical protein